MIFVPVIWANFDFLPCKKKMKNILANIFLFEKGLLPHQNVDGAIATWRNPCHIDKNVGLRTFFKQIFFCKDVFQFFFAGTKIKIDPNYRDENHI